MPVCERSCLAGLLKAVVCVLTAAGAVYGQALPPASLTAQAGEPRSKVRDAVAAAKAQDTEARWSAANEEMKKYVGVMKGIVDERRRAEAAGQCYVILADKARLAEAKASYEKRRAIEAEGNLPLFLDKQPDLDMLFKLQRVLWEYDCRDVLDRFRALSREDGDAVVKNLVSGSKPREGVAIDKVLWEVMHLGQKTTLEGTEEQDAVVDQFCSTVAGWRKELDGKKVHAIADASLLACRARLAQNHEEEAQWAYESHAGTLYRTFDAQTAATKLFDESRSLAELGRFMMARHVVMQVQGDPAKDGQAYLARLTASWFWIRGEKPREPALEELRKVYREDYSTPQTAGLVCDIVYPTPPEYREFAVKVLQQVLPDLKGEYILQGRYRLLINLYELGRVDDAHAQYEILKRDFPRTAQTEAAERFLRDGHF